jgi:hypothetical protein
MVDGFFDYSDRRGEASMDRMERRAAGSGRGIDLARALWYLAATV